MVIQHNLSAYFTSQQMGINSKNKQKSMDKLGSGYKINQAADDAAHLSISEHMRSQIRGLDQADHNIEDGISLLQTADGALNEVHDILHRMDELAVQSANDTNTDEDRNALNDEYLGLRKEINRIAKQTEFNTQQLLYDNSVDVYGSPEDVTIYTDDAGNYAGIVYDKVRYDWSQFKSESDGTTLADATTKSGSYYLDTKLGNRLYFTIDKGFDIPYLCKKYDLEADASDITIDDFDVLWTDVRDEDGKSINLTEPEEGLYHFPYYGSEVFFTVSEGDKFDDILTMLNDTASGSVHSWVSKLDTIGTHEAVYNLDPLQSSVDITVSNKANVDKPPYSIQADSTGIWISGYDSDTSSTVNFTKVAWSDLDFVPDYYGNNKGVDFSTGSGIGDSTWVNFECKDTGISFCFKISDESSKESVIKGLNGITIPTVLNAPVTGLFNLDTTADPTAVPPKNPVMSGAGISSLSIAFDTQRDDLNLDFDSNSMMGASSLGNLQIEFGASGSPESIFTLDSTEMNNLDSFFRYGSSNNINLLFKNSLSDSISINFNSIGNDSDTGRPKSIDYATAADYNTALDNYVTQKIDDFKTQFTDSAVSLKSNNASLEVADFDVNSMASGNSSIAPLYGIKPKVDPPINIQVGANTKQNVDIGFKKINSISLGLGSDIINTRNGATNCIDLVNEAVGIISKIRSKIGANENRLTNAKSLAQNTSEQLQNSESKIRDTDMEEEIVKFAKYNILEQASQSILSQANQSAQGILNLLM